jgi:hypothetical protein
MQAVCEQHRLPGRPVPRSGIFLFHIPLAIGYWLLSIPV